MTDPSEPIVTAHTAPNLSPEAAEALDALAAVAKRQFACGLNHPHPGPCDTRADDAPMTGQPRPELQWLNEQIQHAVQYRPGNTPLTDGAAQRITATVMSIVGPIIERLQQQNSDLTRAALPDPTAAVPPFDLPRLLHLADRARRGVALPAEHDALAAGINDMAAERDTAVAALERVRRFCHLTIRSSNRVAAVDQARDTLTAINPS